MSIAPHRTEFSSSMGIIPKPSLRSIWSCQSFTPAPTVFIVFALPCVFCPSVLFSTTKLPCARLEP